MYRKFIEISKIDSSLDECLSQTLRIFQNEQNFQPGGVFSGFTSSLNTRFISTTIDPIGRWICHRFRGRERDVNIYSIYRVHRKSDDTSGLTTAGSQQRALLKSKNITTNPRDAIMKDLCDLIRKDITSNRSVILMGGFNEGVESRGKTHNRLSEIGLSNLMMERYENKLPKTWNRGKSAIDHVYMTMDVFKAVKKAGFSPFDTISLSDHRGIFFDLDMGMLFDETLKAVEPANFRKLQSSNLKRMKEYNKLVKQEWDNHKIDMRLSTLTNDIKNEGPTPHNVKRLNNIDRHITDIMRFAEKKCTTINRHAVDPWSPKLKELAREIRFFVIQIKNTLRDVIPVSLVDGITKLTTLHAKLGAKRREYRGFLKNAATHRKKHLDERAEYHVEIGKNSSKAGEVKRLKNIEQQKQDSIKIQFTINDISRGSATYILIPHRDAYNNVEGL